MLVFWSTGSGEAVFTMATSACVGEATNTVVEAVLLTQFGSLAEEQGTLILAVLEIEAPGRVPEFTLTTRGKLAVAFSARVAMVQEIVPVPPTAGIVAPQFQPAGGVKETNVVPAGMLSVKVATPETAGPLFVTTWV